MSETNNNNPRYRRVLEHLKMSLNGLDVAIELLEVGHPDRDLLDEIHADLRYAVLKFEGRLT